MSLITIKFEKGKYGVNEHMVYQDEKKIGDLRQFCCGIDFRIKGRPNALFSIIPKMSYEDERLKENTPNFLTYKTKFIN